MMLEKRGFTWTLDKKASPIILGLLQPNLTMTSKSTRTGRYAENPKISCSRIREMLLRHTLKIKVLSTSVFN